MARVRKDEVPITVRYLVDCKVCHEGVETDTDLTTMAEAREARDNHIEEHERGEWGD